MGDAALKQDEVIQKNDFVFSLSPTQEKFVYSDAQVVLFRGPMGEGKTYAGIGGLIFHAARCGRPIRAALVRDTHQNIKISTVPDIQEILGNFVSFHDDYKKMIIHSQPKVECDLFGIDDPASLSKLQGPQYACIWLEEPAPIIEKANAGLPRGVFDMSLARAARQAGTTMRVQITQNPADEDHWTEGIANGPKVLGEDPETGAKIRLEVFKIPRGENKKLNSLARAANIAAFSHDKGKYTRYVLGQAAAVCQGEPVIKNYNPAIHFCDDELPIVPGAIGVRGWDAWHHPACVIGQLVPPGRLIIHDILWDIGVGVKELIGMQVKPLLYTPKYKDKISEWRDIGDPSMRTPNQSTVDDSTSMELERALNTSFEPGPTHWQYRINPAIAAFGGLASDGKPKIQISASAYYLHRTLNGGWYFKTDNNNRIIGTKAVGRDGMSHVGDALLYMISQIFPYSNLDQQYQNRKNMSQQDRMARAMSYSMGRRGGRTNIGVNI